MKFATQLYSAATALAALTLAASCVESHNSELVVVELEGATSADVRLELDNAELDIAGGAEALMEAEFRYPDSDRPRVFYSVEGQHGFLDVFQRNDDNIFTIDDNSWDIALNDDVPLALSIEMDNGDADLRLGNMMVYWLDFAMDNGDATIDLAGANAGDFESRIEVDNGHVRVRVPAQVAAEITVDLDHGDVDAEGFDRDWDGAYVLEGADGAPFYRIHVMLDNGEVDLEIVD